MAKKINLDKEIERVQTKYSKIMHVLKEIENRLHDLFKKRYKK